MYVSAKWTTITGLWGETSKGKQMTYDDAVSFWWQFDRKIGNGFEKYVIKFQVLTTCSLAFLLCWISPTQLHSWLWNLEKKKKVELDILAGSENSHDFTDKICALFFWYDNHWSRNFSLFFSFFFLSNHHLFVCTKGDYKSTLSVWN